MIDKYDIALFRRFLKLAKTEGTDTIKVVSGSKINTWVVTVAEEVKVVMDKTENDLSYNHVDLDYQELIKTARIAVSYSLEKVSERLRDWRDLKKKPTNLNAELLLHDANALATSTAMLHYLEEGLTRGEVEVVNKPEVKEE